MKDDRLYLVHILDCIDRILHFTIDGKNAFLADRKTQDAVLRNLHTLSESIRRISTDTKLKYPEVPWREISAFRNVVVHDYLGIELERIWDIVERDLPSLKMQIKSILDESEGP
ncbi:HepT-like ribonuclease domain-containing protein [Desulfomonile tiedjei]|uniref:DUF86 domain-containing protein n=1 Tax=Desulfomonile tiedjei (strain ATCC 49306 / DSM 6799 / DCB-1) TaxID=706587 RepID=I4CBD6_DESTA|nr:DUF86 domain-containing protein [Desulfomonile tiedjei]AFM26877.1 hypothetical protein Desti_4241 [Desulfomonile tiedjei DSM 6799]